MFVGDAFRHVHFDRFFFSNNTGFHLSKTKDGHFSWEISAYQRGIGPFLQKYWLFFPTCGF